MDTRQLPISRPDLSHAGSDKEFSKYWHGNSDYLCILNYPYWIDLCKKIASDFDREAYLKYSYELTVQLGLKKESQFVDRSDAQYRQFGDNEDKLINKELLSTNDLKEKQKQEENQKKIAREFCGLWSLEKLIKLIDEYLRYRYKNDKNVNLEELAQNIRVKFLKNLINDVINEVAFNTKRYAHQIKYNDDMAKKSLDECIDAIRDGWENSENYRAYKRVSSYEGDKKNKKEEYQINKLLKEKLLANKNSVEYVERKLQIDVRDEYSKKKSEILTQPLETETNGNVNNITNINSHATSSTVTNNVSEVEEKGAGAACGYAGSQNKVKSWLPSFFCCGRSFDPEAGSIRQQPQKYGAING